MKFDLDLAKYFEIDFFKNYDYLLNPDYCLRDKIINERIDEILENNENITDEMYKFIKEIQKLVTKSRTTLYWD